MIGSLLVVAAFAMQHAQATADYPRWAAIMDKWGYDWEAVKVHTEDHYILTTFHVLGKTGVARPSKSAGSVLIQHGDEEDGSSWLGNYATLPFHLKLVDAGYDIWVGNNRGTMYSWDHETLSSASDAAYWDFTWAEMGLYDDVANIKAIKAKSGVDKVFYVGYSQGTIQMHYGLSKLEKTFHAQNVHKAVMLAPCFYANFLNWTKQMFNNQIMVLQDYGVYSFNGPNWEKDKNTICTQIGGLICALAKKDTGQGISVKSQQYWQMNGIKDRFQEFADNWLGGEETTPLVDMSLITEVPIAFFTATNDNVCQHAVAAKYIPLFKSETVQIDVQGQGHLWFSSHANTDWFMQNLIAQLQVPAAAEVFLQ